MTQYAIAQEVASHEFFNHGAFWVFLVAAGIAAALLFVFPDIPRADEAHGPAQHGGTIRVIREHGTILRTLGSGIFLVGVARASRQALLPLWGAYIGLEPATISLIFGKLL